MSEVAPKWVWLAQGAAVPCTLTALTYAVGIYISTQTNHGGPMEHAVNAWLWVKVGVLLSLGGGGVSTLTLLPIGAGPDKRIAASAIWRFVGGCAAFAILVIAAFTVA